MEHPCPSCGASVQEGVLFCGQCGARQAAPSGDSLQAPPAIAPIPAAPLPTPKIDWSKAWPGVLIAGGVGGLLSAAPVVSIGCCLWVLAAGAVSVLFYRNRAAISVPTGMGARLGAVTGMIASLVGSAVNVLTILVMGSGKMRETMRQAMEQSATRNPDPNAQMMAHRLMEFMTSPGGFALIMTVGFAVNFLALLAFASAGGALGASLFGKRETIQ